MKRDKILKEKDRVQKEMWKEAGRNISSYLQLVHEKAKELRRAGLKLRYV